MVASRDLQKAQKDASLEVAAPQFGQLRLSACIRRILAVEYEGGLQLWRCAILWRADPERPRVTTIARSGRGLAPAS